MTSTRELVSIGKLARLVEDEAAKSHPNTR